MQTLPTINIIGAGHLGLALARLIHNNALGQIKCVYNRQIAAAHESCRIIGDGEPVANLKDIFAADITFVTVPDDAIASVCGMLPEYGDIVVHCSGLLGSAVLSAAQQRGASVASVHPFKSFAKREHAVKNFSGTFCAIEGDAEAVRVLDAMFSALGGVVTQIQAVDKPLYHAAAVMACGGLTALFDTCHKMLIHTGIAADNANAMLGPFMRETLENNLELGSERALTGPVARGDTDTIDTHYACLGEYDSDAQQLYAALTKLAEKLQ